MPRSSRSTSLRSRITRSVSVAKARAYYSLFPSASPRKVDSDDDRMSNSNLVIKKTSSESSFRTVTSDHSARFDPTDAAAQSRVFDLLKLTPRDVFFHLGCGDGQLLVVASERFRDDESFTTVRRVRFAECLRSSIGRSQRQSTFSSPHLMRTLSDSIRSRADSENIADETSYENDATICKGGGDAGSGLVEGGVGGGLKCVGIEWNRKLVETARSNVRQSHDRVQQSVSIRWGDMLNEWKRGVGDKMILGRGGRYYDGNVDEDSDHVMASFIMRGNGELTLLDHATAVLIHSPPDGTPEGLENLKSFLHEAAARRKHQQKHQLPSFRVVSLFSIPGWAPTKVDKTGVDGCTLFLYEDIHKESIL